MSIRLTIHKMLARPRSISVISYIRDNSLAQSLQNFFMPNSSEHEICLAHKNEYRKINIFLLEFKTRVVFILLINVKMPTIVGNLTFISRINYMLSYVKHEKNRRHDMGLHCLGFLSGNKCLNHLP